MGDGGFIGEAPVPAVAGPARSEYFDQDAVIGRLIGYAVGFACGGALLGLGVRAFLRTLS